MILMQACPKMISIDTITRLNRDFVRATLTMAPERAGGGEG